MKKLILVFVMVCLLCSTVVVSADDTQEFNNDNSITETNETESTDEEKTSLKSISLKVSSTIIASGTCGTSVSWSLYDDNSLVITGSGNIYDYSIDSAPWYGYRNTIENVVIGNNITSIGSEAFDGCSSLTSINIPNSVTSIGRGAFSGCSSLTSINIPDSVTSIGSFAFSGCSSLTSINIPDSVTSIGDYVFRSCSSLTSINIPDSVTSISNFTFQRCSSLTSINIPDSVTSIGIEAFSGCSSLTSINIPDSVTSIGSFAFSGCDNLAMIKCGPIFNWPNNLGLKSGNWTNGSVTYTAQELYNKWNSSLAGTWSRVYNIYYGINGGANNINNPSTYTYGSNESTLLDPTREGYTFVGWYLNNEKITSIPNHSIGNISIEAKWVANSEHVVYSDNCGPNASFTLYDDNILVVTGSGVMNWNWNTSWPHDPLTEYKNKVENILIEDGITSIDSLFYGCTSLTSITIPDSVTSIGAWAFEGCSSLSTITIPDSVTSIDSEAFRGCSSLTSINIPDSVTSIGSEAFRGCSSLTSINIPDSVTSIGGSAFFGCSSLTSINIPDSVTSIGEYAFFGCFSLTSITIPDSVTSIGISAFQGCEYLTSITIPDSVTSIGEYAFYGCTSLTSLTMPISTSIAYDSFTNVSNLKEVRLTKGTGKGVDYTESTYKYTPWYKSSNKLTSLVLDDGITSIGNYAFRGCTSLTSLTMPISASIASSSSFNYVSNLKEVRLTKGTGKGVDYTYSTYQYTPWYESRNKLTSLVLDDGITSIGNYAFRGCFSLTSINIPDSVTSIGGSAFRYCSSLTSITIPDSVTSIGEYAFSGCSSLKSITIPDSVTSIGNSAFEGCTSLGSIKLGQNINWGDDSCLPSGNWTNGIVIYTAKELHDNWNSSLAGIWSKVYNITYTLSGGTNNTNNPKTYTYEDNEITLLDPTREGYTSDGWYLNNEKITSIPHHSTGDKTIEARWIPNQYTITFDSDGGSAVSSITQDCDSTVNLPDTIKDGYSFLGWYDGNTKVTSLKVPAKNITLKAKWGLNTYNITYTLNGGTNNTNNPKTYTYEDNEITLLDPTREDYEFVGWYLNNEKITSIPNHSTGDKTIEAKWNYLVVKSGKCGSNATYKIFANNSMTITGSGNIYDYSIDSAPWYGYRNTIENVVIGNNITSIGDYAFYNCKSLTSLTMPISASIASNSFTNVSNLKEIRLTKGTGKGVNYTDSTYKYTPWYINRSILTSLVLDDGITSIGVHAFEGCESLISIKIPDSVTSIGGSAFYNCSSLSKITIPDSVTSIGVHAFEGCESLISIKIPDSVKSIGYREFRGCINLQYITLSDSLTSIDYSTFSGCSSLTSITIPDSVTSIGDSAFQGCSSLKSITMPNAVMSIGKSIFDGCSSLEQIKLGSNFNWPDNFDFPSGNWTNGSITYTAKELHDNWKPSLAGTWELVAPTISVPTNIAKVGESININGKPYIVNSDGSIKMPEDANVATVYVTANNTSADRHVQYPKSMKVYTIENNQLVAHPNLDNILSYAGASIRVTGNKGIRIITSIPTSKKNQLINDGIDGYQVMEYGTLMCWASDLANDEEPTLYKDSNGTFKANHGAKGRAYSRESNIYTIYSEGGGTTKYTNTLVGNYTDQQCASDFAMRSYMILRPKGNKNADGDIVVYGGTLYRSISYVAYQNKNAFSAGSNNYEYIWSLIRAGYGNQYDNEYKGNK